MTEYELPKRRWATMVTVAFILLIAAAIAALFFFAPKTETPPAAEPVPAATQPVEPEAPAEPAPAPVATQAPAPEPSQSPTSSIPEPKYTRDDLNLLGQAIWDAFGEDVVLVNGGVQYSDANWNTKVIRPFDPSAALDDEKPLNFQGSNWVIRVTETDAKNGTVWSIVT